MKILSIKPSNENPARIKMSRTLNSNYSQQVIAARRNMLRAVKNASKIILTR